MIISNENEIIEEEKIIFDFEEENFYIEFSEGIWKAISHDLDIDETIIIEDLQRDIFMLEDTPLFGDFVLNLELFNSYKKIIGEKILWV